MVTSHQGSCSSRTDQVEVLGPHWYRPRSSTLGVGEQILRLAELDTPFVRLEPRRESLQARVELPADADVSRAAEAVGVIRTHTCAWPRLR